MAGTPEKMLEYLLETRFGGEKDEADTFVDDFLLTYMAFGLTNSSLCTMLSSYLHQKVDTVSASSLNLFCKLVSVLSLTNILRYMIMHMLSCRIV